MSSALPNSPEFRWRILLLYYGIALPGPAVLVASLFALLDLTGVAWVWLCSFAGGYAVLASAVASKKQLSTLDPITTFLDHRAEDRVADEDCLAGFAAALDLLLYLAMGAMGAWLATVGLTAVSMALRLWSFGATACRVVVTA